MRVDLHVANLTGETMLASFQMPIANQSATNADVSGDENKRIARAELVGVRVVNRCKTRDLGDGSNISLVIGVSVEAADHVKLAQVEVSPAEVASKEKLVLPLHQARQCQACSTQLIAFVLEEGFGGANHTVKFGEDGGRVSLDHGFADPLRTHDGAGNVENQVAVTVGVNLKANSSPTVRHEGERCCRAAEATIGLGGGCHLLQHLGLDEHVGQQRHGGFRQPGFLSKLSAREW